MTHLTWVSIVRLGLVQTALGAVVLLSTSLMNRLMVVELALPAVLPGALYALHYAMQLSRPRMGHGSDQGGRHTPWILGGMVVLGLGGTGAAFAVTLMGTHLWAGIALAALAYVMIGLGVGAAGTTLLVFLGKRVAPPRRPAAATIVWMMMILGFIVTGAGAGHFLEPFSTGRLLLVCSSVCALALALATFAVWGIEARLAPYAPEVDRGGGTGPDGASVNTPFRVALREVLSEPQARRFTVFVFVSMLAYSLQELILEPFAGVVFAMSPGATTSLSGVQNQGVLLGMILVGALAGRLGGLPLWTLGGCVASAGALGALAFGGLAGPGWPLHATVFLLGAANGVYAVAAIGTMMSLVSSGHRSREGVRMGIWGAAQAIAMAAGGFLGTVAVDLSRAVLATPAQAYGLVFVGQALLFLVAAGLAIRATGVRLSASPQSTPRPLAAGELR